MFLNKLSLINYKSFANADYDFTAKINGLVGKNGVGKTNILDAIYHLAFGKSYFNSSSLPNVRHGEQFYMIETFFDKEYVSCSYKKEHKKIISRNGKACERIADHIGLIPLVIISPYDIDLINEGSDVRRKFIDSVICQSDKEYLQQLIRYNKTLEQRNALLKQFAVNRYFDQTNLSLYNDELCTTGTAIFEKRKLFIEEFKVIFDKRYAQIVEGSEQINLGYHSQLQEHTLQDLLTQYVEKDRHSQYTSQGIHKDDLKFEIDGFPIKKYGSQGQQKSFLIALKLAQFDFIKNHQQRTPLLLLDDIFDKLDEHRVQNLIKLVDTADFSQIFITDTHKERIEKILAPTLASHQIFELL